MVEVSVATETVLVKFDPHPRDSYEERLYLEAWDWRCGQAQLDEEHSAAEVEYYTPASSSTFGEFMFGTNDQD